MTWFLRTGNASAGEERLRKTIDGSLPGRFALGEGKDPIMTDPRTPQTKEAQLPDPLDQVPAANQEEGVTPGRGSEDAQLLAGAAAGEGDVEGDALLDPRAEPDDPGRSND